MKRDQESVCKLLRETVGVLCRSGLQFSVGLRVQGLLAVTVDNNDVFVVQFDDLLTPDEYSNTAKTPTHKEQQQQQNYQQTNTIVCKQTPTAHSARQISSVTKQRISDTEHLPVHSSPVVTNSEVITISDDVEDELFNPQQETSQLFPDGTGAALLYSDGQYTDYTTDYKPNFVATDQQYGYNTGAYADLDGTYQQMSNVDVHQDDPGTFDYKVHASRQTARRRPERNALQPFVKQEYRTQPAARQIVSKYRQQKQAAAAAGSTSGPLTITRSLHECGYPGCGKQFRHKQHLLRHQTQKHGRQPKRILTLQIQKVYVKPGAVDTQSYQQDNFNEDMQYT